MKGRNGVAPVICLMIGIVFLGTSVFAAGPPTNPNGFPSGTHYNLNIIGKKAGFNGCTVTPPYGNVVFTPEGSTTGAPVGGDLLFRSGSGRKALTIPGLDPSFDPSTLQVIDQCVTAFDEDAAEVVLPPSQNGYWVYARALGKLTDNPKMTITPGLVQVSSTNADETLTYFGFVTANGFTRYDGVEVIRQQQKGQLKQNAAININELFDWSGYVCYADDPAALGLTGYTLMNMCEGDTNGDGVLDAVIPDSGGCSVAPYTVSAQLWCIEYATEQWVFNIADFVNYFVTLDNNGSKLVQIRFYAR